MKEKICCVYETDASQLKGKVKEVIIPENISQVLEAVKKNDKVVARGGGTGLVGGTVPQDSVVIDLSKLDKIIDFDEKRKKVVVEAGIILEDLNNFLSSYGLEFPVKPSSWKVCTIGGMIATDAVGSRAIKYGRTSRWVEWIDVVNDEGRIERKGKTELSDFAGLEGITGIITSVSLKLVEKKERTASLFSFSSIEEVVKKTKSLKFNQNVSMIEFFDKKTSGLLGLEKNYHLLVEFESEEGDEKGKDYQKLIEIRDSIYPVLAKNGYVRIEDPKIFLEKLEEFMEILEKEGIPVFGHLSVGILHPCFSLEKEKKIGEMMNFILKTRGRVSGEHGIGLVKKEFLDLGTKKL